MGARDLKDEIKRALNARGPEGVARLLGLSGRRDGTGIRMACPFHGGKKPNLHIYSKGGEVLWKCFSRNCQEQHGADALGLIAAHHGLDKDRDFPAVLSEAAAYVNVEMPEKGVSARRKRTRRTVRAKPVVKAPQVESKPLYPPMGEVEAVWFGGRCGGDYRPSQARVDKDEPTDAWMAAEVDNFEPFTGDPTTISVNKLPGAARYLEGRSLSPDQVASMDLAKALLPSTLLPSWCRFGPHSWGEKFPIIVPVYDHRGQMRSLRGWRWQDGDGPKRVAAKGFQVRGLVMANSWGRMMLEYAPSQEVLGGPVVITEGEPDFLAASLQWPTHAVLGIVAGAWTDEIAARVPGESKVVVKTDHDEAGDRYAARITESLVGRCEVFVHRNQGAQA